MFLAEFHQTAGESASWSRIAYREAKGLVRGVVEEAPHVCECFRQPELICRKVIYREPPGAAHFMPDMRTWPRWQVHLKGQVHLVHVGNVGDTGRHQLFEVDDDADFLEQLSYGCLLGRLACLYVATWEGPLALVGFNGTPDK